MYFTHWALFVTNSLNSLTHCQHVGLYNPLEMMPLVQYDHKQSSVKMPPSTSTWMERTSGREEGRGGGGQPAKQGALYSDWLFSRWLIVVHSPVCSLRKPALMFAEWHTAWSECPVWMFGVTPISPGTHTQTHTHCQFTEMYFLGRLAPITSP